MEGFHGKLRFPSYLVMRGLLVFPTTIISNIKAKIHTNPLDTRVFLIRIRSYT